MLLPKATHRHHFVIRIRHPSSVIRHPYPSSVIRHPSSVIRHPSSVIRFIRLESHRPPFVADLEDMVEM
jgi:hypothetical protein